MFLDDRLAIANKKLLTMDRRMAIFRLVANGGAGCCVECAVGAGLMWMHIYIHACMHIHAGRLPEAGLPYRSFGWGLCGLMSNFYTCAHKHKNCAQQSTAAEEAARPIYACGQISETSGTIAVFL